MLKNLLLLGQIQPKLAGNMLGGWGFRLFK